jgi:diaminopimelate epimerase
LKRSEIPMKGDETEKVVSESLKVEGQKFDITAVSMGNPHVVIFEDKLKDFPVAKWGSLIENHKSFPARTNVHFVSVCNTGEAVVRTWERGAGETLACGTGACAVLVACVLNGKTNRTVDLHLPGGDLRVEWNGDNRVFMTGPAEEVFTGEIVLS